MERMKDTGFRGVNAGLVLGAMLVLGLARCAHAECVTVKAWQARVEKASSAELLIIDASLLPDDARDILAGMYNETPPKHDPIMPDQAVQLISKSKKYGLPFPYVLIGFFRHGCSVGMFELPISTGMQ